jgi:hypothetical protein
MSWDDDMDVELAPNSRPYARKSVAKTPKPKKDSKQTIIDDIHEYRVLSNRALRKTPFNQCTITVSAIEEGYTRVNGLLVTSLFLCGLGFGSWLTIQYVFASIDPINMNAFMLSIAIIGAIGIVLFILMIIWYFGDYSRLDDLIVYGMIEPVALIIIGGFVGLILFNSIKNDDGTNYMSYDIYQTARFYSVLMLMNVFFAAGFLFTPRMIMCHMSPMRKLKDVVVIELDADEAQSLKKRKGVDNLVLDKVKKKMKQLA